MKGLTNREKVLSAALILFVLLTFLRGCENKGVRTSLKKLSYKVDTVHVMQKTQISKDELTKLLKIEGLKSELRMIESTDRRMMDKNRQSEIRKEIEQLEK